MLYVKYWYEALCIICEIDWRLWDREQLHMAHFQSCEIFGSFVITESNTWKWDSNPQLFAQNSAFCYPLRNIVQSSTLKITLIQFRKYFHERFFDTYNFHGAILVGIQTIPLKLLSFAFEYKPENDIFKTFCCNTKWRNGNIGFRWWCFLLLVVLPSRPWRQTCICR